MEKKLVKTAVYSFIFGLMLGLLFYKDVHTYTNGMGIVTQDVPLRQYLFKLFRFAVKLTIAAVAAVWIKEAARISSEDSFAFLLGFIKSFFIVFALIMLVCAALMFIF